MRLALSLLLLSPLTLAAAQEPKGKKPADPKTWMSLRGPLLWEEHFENGAYSKEWSRYKGNFVVEKGQLKVAEVPTDGHLPTLVRGFKESNVVIQFAFKFEGAKMLGFQLDDASHEDKKEHVAQITIQPDGFRVERMTGFGPTTKNQWLDQKKAKFDAGAWHTMVFEIVGDEMTATVDDETIALGKSEGMPPVRTRVQFVSAGEWAWFKDIKVWKAEPDPKWSRKKAAILERAKK